MSKLAGSFLILIAAFLIGYLPVYSMKQRVRLLYFLINSLEKMKAELTTNQLTIPELIDSLCDSVDSYNCGIYKHIQQEMNYHGPVVFYKAWNDYVEEKLSQLTDLEKDAMGKLGSCLGRYVIEEEIKLLTKTINLLELGCKETKEEIKETEKLYTVGALSFGGMIVIALL